LPSRSGAESGRVLKLGLAIRENARVHGVSRVCRASRVVRRGGWTAEAGDASARGAAGGGERGGAPGLRSPRAPRRGGCHFRPRRPQVLRGGRRPR